MSFYKAEKIAMNEELTWAEILRSAVALGLIDGSGSKAEAVKIQEMLTKQIEVGRVERIAHGRYQFKFVPGLLEEPEANDDG
jgi:hypothetical protein